MASRVRESFWSRAHARTKSRYLALALPLFSLGSAIHTGCSSSSTDASPYGTPGGGDDGTGSCAKGAWDVQFQWQGRTPGALFIVTDGEDKAEIPVGPGVGATTGTATVTDSTTITWSFGDGSTMSGAADAKCAEVLEGRMSNEAGNTGVFTATRLGRSCGVTSLPAGSFSKTCKDCAAVCGVVRCACGDGSGAYGYTQLNTEGCTQDIANCWGELTCGDCKAKPNPGGCTANVDCGSCERCELSTGNCRTRLTCP